LTLFSLLWLTMNVHTILYVNVDWDYRFLYMWATCQPSYIIGKQHYYRERYNLEYYVNIDYRLGTESILSTTDPSLNYDFLITTFASSHSSINYVQMTKYGIGIIILFNFDIVFSVIAYCERTFYCMCKCWLSLSAGVGLYQGMSLLIVHSWLPFRFSPTFIYQWMM
jgi:hypothetical protein